MNRLQSSFSLFAVLATVGVLGLSGCAGFGGVAFPDASPIAAPAATSTGGIQGQNWGGHAPLVGAHIYMVQPGTTGYGSVVTGLISASTAGATANGSWTNSGYASDQFVPTTDAAGKTFYGVTTDMNGQFRINNVTCTVGQPVYLVGYGGSASFLGQTGGSTQTNTFPISSITVSNVTGQASGAGTATYTFNIGGGNPELFYPGETVTFANTNVTANTNASPTYFNSGTYTVSATGLSTTSFQLTFNADYGGYTAATSPYFPAGTTTQNGTATVTANPPFNPAAVNVASLGNCPASGSFDSGPAALNFIWMNEVSTTAWAYAFNQFANFAQPITATTNGTTTVTLTGASAGNSGGFQAGQFISGPGIPTGDTITAVSGNTLTLATAATASGTNVALTVNVNDQTGNDTFHIGAPSTTQAQQGIFNAALTAGNLYDIQGSNVTTVFAGEGHIARTQTPSGAGIVPQDELDTIGNILAACVDSNNTYRAGSGTTSSQCGTLDKYATDNGVYDTTNYTTHYAFNIAQAALNIAHFPQGAGIGSSTGGSANYGGTQTITTAPSSSTASAFVSNLYALSTGQVPFTPNLTSDGSGAPNDFSIGINWQTSPYARSTTPTSPSNGTPATPTTAPTGSNTNNVTNGEVAIDSLGNAWLVDNVVSATGLYRLTPSGYYTVFGPTYYDSVGVTNLAGLAIDTSNNIFVAATAGALYYPASNYAQFQTGAIGYIPPATFGTQNTGQVAVDSSGYLYLANLNLTTANTAATVNDTTSAGSTASSLAKFPPTLGNATPTYNVPGTTSVCGGYLGYLTLDAVGNVWTSNQAFPFTGSAVCRITASTGAVQNIYSTSTATASTDFFHQIAIDRSGNAWVSDYQPNLIVNISAAVSSGSANTLANTYSAPGGPQGLAIDGANTVWTGNGYQGSGKGSISQYSTSTGANLSPTYYTGYGFNTVSSGSPAGTPTTQTTPNAQYLAIDQSGNIWADDTAHGQVIEFIGVAAPVAQPLAQQRANTVAANGRGIGQRP